MPRFTPGSGSRAGGSAPRLAGLGHREGVGPAARRITGMDDDVWLRPGPTRDGGGRHLLDDLAGQGLFHSHGVEHVVGHEVAEPDDAGSALQLAGEDLEMTCRKG
jgi:hypothetical protein